MGINKENLAASTHLPSGSEGPSEENSPKPNSDPEATEVTDKRVRREDSLTKEAIAGATVLVADASGFAIYEGASVALGTASSAAGITLPFSAYSGASIAISWATGPAALAAIGACALWKLF